MRIPSGDLAPARKHRHGSSFRRRRRWPYLLAVLLIAGVAAGTYYVRRDNSTTETVVAASSCPSPVASPKAITAAPKKKAAAPIRLPAPGQVSLRLLNGTGRDGLARGVAAELAHRGFRVSATGNAPRPLVGASRVYFGPGARNAALLVSAHVLGSGIQPVPTAAPGAVDVVLGSTFVRLRTPTETSSYAHQLVTSGPPTVATQAPKPKASPTCR